ncbi:PREDICTED: uncharacterized protein LOC106750014 [Dinoponera quadriceps]|uniref:Uncharacterized protein LOC106750014 n=1 Tax=Dinoponera quadriceps TaxID=609295 RepID=A0A6P3Y5Y7_DINQU|nr:PREDICTED: uncharacterized protein LOC106750014 [Dinoponera quadriceps]
MTSLEYDADDVAAPGEDFSAVDARKPHGSEVDRANRAQIRGGQDCTDRGHPANIDAAKYLESAHCLRFSDLWYSVYQLEDPIIEHTVYLQVYEKRALMNGSAYWRDLTGGSIVRLGTFNRRHRSGEDTIVFAYEEAKTTGRTEVPNLDVAGDRLLVPSSVTSKDSEYPVEDGGNEYLVVPASRINENGNECDKAGVGFAAFAGQPDRCEHVRGTCLKNQPLAYRRHDVEARAAGRPGCYFLSNFASVPSEPIKYSANGSREFLALEYHSAHVSAIDIEISYNAAAGKNCAVAFPVQLLNRHGEPVATRRIRIRKMDRCSCVSRCSCVGDRSTDCRPMSPELYHATGFRGAVPLTPPRRGIFSNLTVDVLFFLISLILLLFFMGFMKWLIGLCIPAVNRWGLDSLLATDRMSEYFEQELKYKCVVKDERGAPETRVRICGSLTSDERPGVICVSTYSDSRDSKMEAEDTEYVMNELNKSEESLRSSHSGSKRNRRTKEYRSRR